MSTPGWGCDRPSSLGCDGAPGSECSGITGLIVPALAWDKVPGFRGGTCVLEFMGIGHQDTGVMVHWASEARRGQHLRAQR